MEKKLVKSAGFLMVGGLSTRMRRPKALLTLGGRPLAVTLAGRVRRAAGSATLVGRCVECRRFGWPMLPDAHEGIGPLGGIHAALLQTRARWNLMLGCDLPFVTAAFLRFLVRTAESSRGAQVVVPVMPVSEDGRYQPLVAAYRHDCLAAAEEALAAGRLGVHQMLDRLKRREVQPREWRRYDPRGLLFFNVNTPADLARARRHWPRTRTRLPRN